MVGPEGMGLRPEVASSLDDAGEDDLEIVRRCRAGEPSAWRALYDAHHGFVFRVARRLGTPAEETEDVVHEVFIVVLKKIDHFQGGRFTTWIYRITANVVSHRHRKRRTRQALTDMAWRIGLAEPPTPEALSAAASDARAVEKILERMSPKKRAVFALFELEGLSGEEIAEREGCPLNTVWSRLRHAREDFCRIGSKMGLLEDAR
jgi:RNA polymerase sigma-70 factor (ECF subfamily)